jgi:hypothetical protein
LEGLVASCSNSCFISHVSGIPETWELGVRWSEERNPIEKNFQTNKLGEKKEA